MNSSEEENKQSSSPQVKAKFEKARKTFFNDVKKTLSKKLPIISNIDEGEDTSLVEKPIEVVFRRICTWETKNCAFLNKLSVSPTVIRFIRDTIEGASNVDIDPLITKDVPLDVIVCLTIWYLSKTDPIVRAVRLFRMKSLTEVTKLIQYGLSLIVKLKKQSDLTLPEYPPFLQDSSQHFAACGFPGVVGVVGHEKLSTDKLERQYSLWYFVNQKRIYKSIEYSEKPGSSRKPAAFIHDLNLIPKEFKLIGLPIMARGNGRYSLKTKIVTLSTRNNNPLVALRFEKAIDIGDTAIRETVDRFPRVTKLKWLFHESVLAACIMHNFCVMFMDDELHADAHAKYN